MPAWQAGLHIGIKVVTIFPDNDARSLPSVMGAYLLLDGKTGAPIALIDGPMLTVKRTAAASALASSYLSRPDCERFLMIGTGSLAPYLIMAHASVRPICNVLIWGRSPDKAARLAKRLDRPDFRVAATDDLEAAVRGADVIALQEVDRFWRRTGMIDQPAELSRRLPDYHWVYGANLDIDASYRDGGDALVNRRKQFGTMLLSRSPILSSRNFPLPKYGALTLHSIQQGLLEGVVDLAFLEDQDGSPAWTVVDFKTDRDLGEQLPPWDGFHGQRVSCFADVEQDQGQRLVETAGALELLVELEAGELRGVEPGVRIRQHALHEILGFAMQQPLDG